MKCPVCHTKIPIGSHECPNCGMELRDHQSTSYKKTYNLYKPLDPKKPTFKVMNILMVVVLCLTIFFIGRLFVTQMFGSIYDSYEEALEKVDDQQSIQTIIDLQKPIIKALSNHTYDYCHVNEKVQIKDGQTIVTTQIDATYQHFCDVEVYIQVIDNEVVHYTIQYGGFYSGQISRLKLPVDQKAIDSLMDSLDYVNAYEQYEECRALMFNKSGILEETYIEKEYDDYNLVVNEMYERAYDQSNYQLMYVIK